MCWVNIFIICFVLIKNPFLSSNLKQILHIFDKFDLLSSMVYHRVKIIIFCIVDYSTVLYYGLIAANKNESAHEGNIRISRQIQNGWKVAV